MKTYNALEILTLKNENGYWYSKTANLLVETSNGYVRFRYHNFGKPTTHNRDDYDTYNQKSNIAQMIVVDDYIKVDYMGEPL